MTVEGLCFTEGLPDDLTMPEQLALGLHRVGQRFEQEEVLRMSTTTVFVAGSASRGHQSMTTQGRVPRRTRRAGTLFQLACAAAVACGAVPTTWAEEAEAPMAPVTRYVELTPSFVTNYGPPGNGRLKFVRADVTLKVSTRDAETAIRTHNAQLRNAMVMLLSSQQSDEISTTAGRDEIRAAALAELRTILQNEEGAAMVEDVLFTNFLVQR